MKFMLDTSTCIDLLRAGPRPLLDRLRTFEPDEITISSMTLAELHYGVARARRRAHHEGLLALFCAPLAILPFDEVAAEVYGRVRAGLEHAGTPIGPLDTLIASHALAAEVTLVTGNRREFSRVEGLRIEDWREGASGDADSG